MEPSSRDFTGGSSDSPDEKPPQEDGIGHHKPSLTNSLTMDSPDVCIKRRPLTVESIREEYKYEKPHSPGFRETVKSELKSQTECSTRRVKKTITSKVPIIDWLFLHYSIKKNLLGDAIAGFTVAVMNIPQGMAYAMMAYLPPISGIYMAFYPVLVYAIFGSSRHCSMGTFAVICLMTGKVVSELATFPDETGSSMDKMEVINGTEIYSPTEVACILSFSVGMWLLVFALLQLGSLSVFLSDMLVSGFTTGAAVHVFTSQIKHILGIDIPSFTGPGKILRTWKTIFGQMLYSNPATIVISAICLVILIFNNEVIKPRLATVTKIPIPIELIVVVMGTLASKWGNLSEAFNIPIVGEIPTGLPPPEIPQFSLFGKVIVDALIIAIVSFTISYSMARIFAKKGDYNVDASQELTAAGLGNLTGSLFQCAPISCSLSRTLIQFNVGGKTQLTAIICASILLMVLLFIGPFFETLPNCVLASIIVVALKGMFLQFGDFRRMFKVSRVDAALWMITFLAVVVIDIDYGLLIGILFSVVLLLARNQAPDVQVLGRVPHTEFYLEKERYSIAKEIDGIRMCSVTGNLHFANQEAFRNSLAQTAEMDPRKILKARLKKAKKEKKLQAKLSKKLSKTESKQSPPTKSNSYSQQITEDGIVITEAEIIEEKPTDEIPNETLNGGSFNVNITEEESYPDFLIVSLAGVPRADISACRNLALMHADYAEAEIAVLYAGTTELVFECLQESGALSTIPVSTFFHGVPDAVAFINTFDQDVKEKSCDSS